MGVLKTRFKGLLSTVQKYGHFVLAFYSDLAGVEMSSTIIITGIPPK